jgi:tetratricopeptide (TPR) repeat protein
MPTPALPEVEAAAEKLARAVASAPAGPESLWQIAGVATAGKSSCLARLADRLQADTTLKPIIVSPPAHHLDAGPSALNDVAVGLAKHGFLNGEFAAWQAEPMPWLKRVQAVRDWVSGAKDEVVLLCDEPRSWGANRELDDFFARRSFDAAFFLSGLPCRRVVTGKLAVPLAPLERVELRPSTPEREWLADVSGWGTLATAAAQLADSTLLRRSPTALQVRLLIAVVALTSLRAVEEHFSDSPDPRGVVRLLAHTITETPGHRRLWEAWHALSLTRRSLDDDLLKELIPTRLTTLERDIVRNCLLYGEDELQLHDVLKLHAARWRAEHQETPKVRALVDRTTRKLFAIHSGRFVALSAEDEPAAVAESMEAFHFAASSGDAKLIQQATPLFVEQLDALGWSLSYERRDYVGAANAFSAALNWDDQDDYAHHYLAYNLDRAGRSPDDVEAHYRRAIELNPTHPWWRSRLVIFLLSEGRLADARDEWDDALFEIGVGEGDASPALYERLHCWVAGAFLAAGEVRFAREILDEVPAAARPQIDLYSELTQRADALLELGDGPAVVPGWRLRPEWWTSGPELLQYRFGTGEQLVRWLAGRVESKDEAGIHLRAAVLEVGQHDPPRIAWSAIPFERFDELRRDEVRAHDLPVGAFLEVGLYASSGGERQARTLIRVLPDRDWGAPIDAADRGRRATRS